MKRRINKKMRWLLDKYFISIFQKVEGSKYERPFENPQKGFSEDKLFFCIASIIFVIFYDSIEIQAQI